MRITSRISSSVSSSICCAFGGQALGLRRAPSPAGAPYPNPTRPAESRPQSGRLPPIELCALVLAVAFPLSAQMRLAELEQMALANNPAIAQAAAGTRAAEGRLKQAGLYPNPVLGANGEHVTPVIDGGSVGGFVEQRFVTGGKLGLAKQAAKQERLSAVEMQNAARLAVLTSVRTLFYRALGEQRLVELRREMADVAGRTAQTLAELNNVGQADRPDQLAAEIESGRALLAATLARNALDRTWREIAAVVNQPSLRPAALEGDLDALPKIDAEEKLAEILGSNPDLRTREIEVARSTALTRRARAENIPDIRFRGGVRYNREPIDGSAPRAIVGPEGIFDLAVDLPIFNRNQGAIAAAQAEAERARLAVDRERLEVRSRFAEVFRQYSDALAASQRYRDELVPKARQAFDMYSGNFRQMAAAYPQVLNAQRNLVQLQDEYIAELISAWAAAMEIEGMLVKSGS
jgi:outer membrane protein, heavy metal efflux system